jgi:hypothetical protein
LYPEKWKGWRFIMMGFGGFFGILLSFAENLNGLFFGSLKRMWSAEISTSRRTRRDRQGTEICFSTVRIDPHAN